MEPTSRILAVVGGGLTTESTVLGTGRDGSVLGTLTGCTSTCKLEALHLTFSSGSSLDSGNWIGRIGSEHELTEVVVLSIVAGHGLRGVGSTGSAVEIGDGHGEERESGEDDQIEHGERMIISLIERVL